MGGNVRHASKGPDKKQSTCDQCDTEFTHGKFSHPTYCPSCRDNRRNPDDVITTIDLDVDTDTRTVTVTVTFENNNDVPVRDIPLEGLKDDRGNLIGHVRLDSDHEFAAETAWIEHRRYGTLKLRPEHTRDRAFVWTDNTFTQDTTSTTPQGTPVGTEYRELAEMSRGDPFDATELTATFIPAEDCPELDSATATVDVPSYLVDL